MKFRISFYSLLIVILIFCFAADSSSKSKLNPGFDPSEYKTMLEITARQLDTPWVDISVPFPDKCRLVYRSDTLGLNNRWDLWVRDDSVGIISIRGTIGKPNSWSENYFAAMVPAKGSIVVSTDNIFVYKLAESEKASIHTGWLLGLAYLSGSIVEKINEQYIKGIKDYIIIGHSQGGALAYLLTSYLYYLEKDRKPDDITFKTYCSAPPKPGNMFYANDFDYITRGGWALRIYNTEDWVPQTPFSVQTFKDFAAINPYTERDSLMVKMNFIHKIIFEYIIKRFRNQLDDTRDLIDEYFGKEVYEKQISKFLPEFPKPLYSNDSYYYPCGVPVVLIPQPGYEEIIKSETKIPLLFRNHMVIPYYYLLNKIYFNN